jgi:hypothetical protein
MSKIWQALPVRIRSYLGALAEMWLSIAGLSAVTWGVCLFSLPFGVIIGGFCALLLDMAIGMTLSRGEGRRW